MRPQDRTPRRTAPWAQHLRRCLGLCALLVALAGFPQHAAARGSAAKQEKVEDSPYPLAFRTRVNAAVAKGVKYLAGRQHDDGHWLPPKALAPHQQGYTALMTLAMLHGGADPEGEAVTRAFAAMRKLPFSRTYDVGTALMALHTRYAEAQNPWAPPPARKARPNSRRKGPSPCEKRMPAELRAWMAEGVAFLLKHKHDGHWHYPRDNFDLSNTQFALLGLWAAARCGHKIEAAVWLESLNWLTRWQERTGRPVELQVNEVRGKYRVSWKEPARARGFRYREGEPVTGSMTTAGMAGLAICQEMLWGQRAFKPALRRRVRLAIRDAMAWLQEHFDVTANPGATEPGHFHSYYLYGMERAGMLSRFRFMGRHDWYLEGANYLLDAQGSDGRWSAHDTLRDTAFGVLFLKRSAGRLSNPVVTER